MKESDIWCQIGDKIDTQISWPWKHLFVSKIVLRVIVCCLPGVGSVSSSRRIPRFVVLFSSGHRCMTSYEARKKFMQISWLHQPAN